MMMYVLALVVLSYLIFVFISDLFNPFIATRKPLRKRRWRMGRAAALSSLIAGTISLLALSLTGIDLRSALIVYLVLLSIFIIPSVVKYKRTALWQ